MKIVMITPDCYMIDRRILLEAKSLIKAGHSVTLLAGFECPKEEHYTEDGIEIHRYVYDWDDERLKKIRSKLPNNDKLKMYVNKMFMLLAKSIFEINPFEQFMISKLLSFEADVYHVHDLPCLKVGISAARKKNVPIAYDAHELYYAQEILPKSLQKKYYALEKRLIKIPDLVTTVNPFIAKLMAERYNAKEPHVIMNCTELPNNFVKDRNFLRIKSNTPDDWNIVLYQGWISPERNIDTLIKGVKYFPQKTKLVVIGYGDYLEKLKELTKLEQIEDKVVFLGKVPSEEMLNYSAGADLGIIPYKPIDDNHLYCSPNKLFEYVLAGVPIISGKLPFFELMNEKYGFIATTDIDSPEAFGCTITEILNDKERIKTLKDNCEKASQALNWDEEGKKLVNLYEKYIRVKN